MKKENSGTKVLRAVVDNRQASVRIVGFPPAGSGPMFFQAWKSLLPDTYSLDAVNIPGREHRIGEPFATSIEPIVREVVDALAVLTHEQPKPLVFFGHSFGASLAFEVCQALKQSAYMHMDAPIALCVSAHCGPMHRTPIGDVYNLGDAELVKELQRFEGLPPEVFNSEEYTKLALPIIRADLYIDYHTPLRSTPVLDIPLLILIGQDDHVAPSESMEQWHKITTAQHKAYQFNGGHFYIRQYLQEVLAAVDRFVVEQQAAVSQFSSRNALPTCMLEVEYRKRSSPTNY